MTHHDQARGECPFCGVENVVDIATTPGDYGQPTWHDLEPQETCPHYAGVDLGLTRDTVLFEDDEKNTTTCAKCGEDFPDGDMIPLDDGGGELCPECSTAPAVDEDACKDPDRVYLDAITGADPKACNQLNRALRRIWGMKCTD